MDEIIYGRICAMQAEMFALQAEVEGMKALNQYRIDKQETIAYDDGAFHEKADQLRGVSNELQVLTHE